MQRAVCSAFGAMLLTACAGTALAGVSITSGSVGGSASADPFGKEQAVFACAGVPAAGSSCPTGPGALDSPACDIQTDGSNASQDAQVQLSASGGAAGTSGGLGDDPLLASAPKAQAQGFISADAGAAANGSFEISMCGGISNLGVRGESPQFSANINTPGVTFRVDLPGNQPVPFTETYSGDFAPQGLHAFEPDLSDPNPGAITQVNGQDFIAPGAYILTQSFSATVGTRSSDQLSFEGTYRLVIGNGTDCCKPWDNGRYDGRNGQTSQIGVDQDWMGFARVSFDDFWLCEGQLHRIGAVRGTMSTNSAAPKFIVAILPDCDGRPDITRPLAVAGLAGTRFDVDQADVPFVLGSITIENVGPPDAQGFSLYDVRADFPRPKRVNLRGGAYWVTIFGVSGNLNPLDEFFWGSSGLGVVKGRPGVFYDGQEFFDSDQLCCGCTDYNFCVEGQSCKILLDNGPPVTQFGPPHFPAVASLQNGQRTSDKSRAADKVVFPPCSHAQVCYIEGWVWTNCERVSLEVYLDACHCPDDDLPPEATRQADCVWPTGITATDPTGQVVELKRAEFSFDQPMIMRAAPGTDNSGGNFWLSLVGQGDNRQNARAWFAFGVRCDNPCTNFGPGCFRPAPFDITTWRPNGLAGTSVPGNDHALLVAVTEPDRTAPPPPVTEPACAADVNRSGDLTVQDLFDFLAAYFAGCP